MITPEKVVGRMSLYRRLLSNLKAEGVRSIFSHELATMAGGTAAQVRRDMMAIGYSGSPVRGYDVDRLIRAIGLFLDAPSREGIALVGIGNLGRAIMAFFEGRRPNLAIEAAFDSNPDKVNRVIHGCRCYPLEDLGRVVEERNIRVGIIAVPAQAAQSVAEALVAAGVRGLVNFAPVPLHVPPGTYVDDMDITMSIEKVAYFARLAERDLVRKV